MTACIPSWPLMPTPMSAAAVDRRRGSRLEQYHNSVDESTTTNLTLDWNTLLGKTSNPTLKPCNSGTQTGKKVSPVRHVNGMVYSISKTQPSPWTLKPNRATSFSLITSVNASIYRIYIIPLSKYKFSLCPYKWSAETAINSSIHSSV